MGREGERKGENGVEGKGRGGIVEGRKGRNGKVNPPSKNSGYAALVYKSYKLFTNFCLSCIYR